MDNHQDVIESNISRVVALLTAPLSGILAAGLLWLQDKVGINLQIDPAASAAFISSIVLTAALTAYKWLEGRAKFELASLDAHVYRRDFSVWDPLVGPLAASAVETPIIPPGLSSNPKSDAE